jgi:hypothetical protein
MENRGKQGFTKDYKIEYSNYSCHVRPKIENETKIFMKRKIRKIKVKYNLHNGKSRSVIYPKKEEQINKSVKNDEVINEE